jgi:phage host-nuclease inhibitor protein Gam
MSRRKQEALEVPASEAEAMELLRSYASGEHAILALRLSAEVEMGAIAKERDEAVAVIAAEQDRRFRSLKAWWEAGGSQLAGRRRSISLNGIAIGLRLTPPKVKFARGVNALAVVEWLMGLRWARKKDFLRTKTDLDRQAVIKAALADKAVAETFEPKLTIVQDDEFFIDAGLDEEAMRKAMARDGE